MPTSKMPLFYDQQEGRWCVELETGTYGFHCGQVLWLSLDDHLVHCQMEYEDGWYVIISNHRFDLRPGATYTVAI